MTTTNPNWVPVEDLAKTVEGMTTPKAFLAIVAEHPDLVMLRSMRGEEPGQWDEWTATEYADLTAKAAAGLRHHGLAAGERMLLMMRNRPDFHWFDAAAQFLRATPVSIYNSSSPEEIQYLAGHAEAEIAVVEDSGFLERILKVREELPELKKIFVINPPADALPDGVLPAAELLGQGSLDLAELAAETSPDDLATLIYTSGTTGPPKGVMISQGNVVYTAEQLRLCFGADLDFLGKRTISYLPMAHIAERMTSHYQGMLRGLAVTSCPDPTQIAAYAKEVHPELIFGVPRVWEKIYLGVNAALSADPERKQKFEEGRRGGPGDQGRRAGRDGHPGAEGHLGLPGRGRLLTGPRAARARCLSGGHHRRRTHPPVDPRVVQRRGHPAQRDLRHVGVLGADDLGRLGHPAGHRRARHPRVRGAHRRGR